MKVLRIYLYLIFLTFIKIPTLIAAEAEIEKLTKYENIPALEEKQGYLLVKLEVDGIAPSIEVVKLKHSDTFYLKKNERVKKIRTRRSFMLKKLDNDYYFFNLPEGLYSINKIKAPYFNFPFKLDTGNRRFWRFSIKKGKVNYMGKLIIKKVRSSRSIDVSLIARIATDYEEINRRFKPLLTLFPLVSGSGFRDDFIDIYSQSFTDE